MIQQAETLIEYGYLPLDLKPRSVKPILAACDTCGKVRETTKDLYHSLCISCALKGKKHALGSKRSVAEKRNRSDRCKGEKNPFFGKHHTIETKVIMSEAHKGEKSCKWKGGISFGKYCHRFNTNYKRKIRERFDNKCFLCSKTQEENGRALDVHHVNYNKNCGCDGVKCICVPLCIACHAKTGSNRKYWKRKIKNKLKESLLGY